MVVRKEFHFTPCGVAEPDCAIHRPDEDDIGTVPSNLRGLYSVELTISSHKAQPLIDLITTEHKANYKAQVAEFKKSTIVLSPGRKPLKPYEGDMPYFINADGSVTFKFNAFSSRISKRARVLRPWVLKVVDSKGRRIKNVPAISGGSELKVRFSMFAYGFSAVAGAGVKLQLDSVMLIRLVGPEGDSSDDGWGNEAVEGGYETARFIREAMVKTLPRFVPDDAIRKAPIHGD